MVIHHIHQPVRTSDVLDAAFVQVHEDIWVDGKHILHAVLDDHDRDTLVRQLTKGLQGLVGGSRVEAGKGFVQ